MGNGVCLLHINRSPSKITVWKKHIPPWQAQRTQPTRLYYLSMVICSRVLSSHSSCLEGYNYDILFFWKHLTAHSSSPFYSYVHLSNLGFHHHYFHIQESCVSCFIYSWLPYSFLSQYLFYNFIHYVFPPKHYTP